VLFKKVGVVKATKPTKKPAKPTKKPAKPKKHGKK
jgi:hypothetical protein